jgi:predicted Zn-dependent protease with MMP-like domain
MVRLVGVTRFEELAALALDGLPAWVQERLDNVDVVIEDEPPEDDPDLLGLYQGIPLTERGMDYGGALPDRISLYRRTIEDEAGGDEEELQRVIAETVAHEVAHHFGISDERLQDLGRDQPCPG